jgi:hypothetical protein
VFRRFLPIFSTLWLVFFLILLLAFFLLLIFFLILFEKLHFRRFVVPLNYSLTPFPIFSLIILQLPFEVCPHNSESILVFLLGLFVHLDPQIADMVSQITST